MAAGRGGPTATATATAPTTAPAGGPITLAFGGDVHFAARAAALLDDPATGLAALRPYLAGADVAMVNLESAITERGTPAPKQFHFRTPATALDALASAGIDVVTMANNHAVDYGAAGLQDTLAALGSAPIPVVGIGADEARAYAPAYLTVRGTRIAVLGATQIYDWTLSAWPARGARPGVAVAANPARLVTAVHAARAHADLVVVYLHWGTDYTSCPNALQRSTATALAAAGADVIVGSHAHVLQGAGWLGDSYVDYGLGNFVWWRRNTAAEASTGVLTLTVADRRVTAAVWTPLTVSADALPRPPSAAATAGRRSAWLAARSCTGLAAHPAG